MLSSVSSSLRVAPFSETNVCCFCVAKTGESLSRSNERTLELYNAFSPEANGSFFVSKTEIHRKSYEKFFDHFTEGWKAKVDTDRLVLIRLCLMNPFFSSKETRTSFLESFCAELRDLLVNASSLSGD